MYLRILHPVFNLVVHYRNLFPTVYLSVADIANPDLLACACRTWINLDMGRLYEEQCHRSSESAWPAFPKDNGKSGPIAGGGRHNLHSGLPDRCDSSIACMQCRLEPSVFVYNLIIILSTLLYVV